MIKIENYAHGFNMSLIMIHLKFQDATYILTNKKQVKITKNEIFYTGRILYLSCNIIKLIILGSEYSCLSYKLMELYHTIEKN